MMKPYRDSHRNLRHSRINKKGLSGPALIGTFILVFLMVFGLIKLYQNVMKGGTQVLDCKKNGGDCVPGTCDFLTQIPALSDKAAGCKSGELCCINTTKSSSIPNPKCANATTDMNNNKATPCGVRMYCDASLQCVTRCEFCSKNYNTDFGRNICIPASTNIDIKIFENVKKLSSPKTLSCSCTKAQCDAKKGECVTGFCPADKDAVTATDYACCTTT